MDEEDEITNILPEEEAQKSEESLQAKVKELEDKYLRTYADFENFRKRVVKEKEEVMVATSERLLRELLDVKDHLELALAHSKGAADVKSLRDGVELTLKQMGKFLEKFGVQEVSSLGEPFNPALHEAIQQVDSVEFRPNTVTEEFQKGYLFHGRLLRPARVSVATSKPTEEEK